MGYILANFGAIALATAAGLLVGALYRVAAGRRAGVPASIPALAAAAVLAEFWLASILAGALILAPPGPGPWVMALGSAVVIWIGFVLPALLTTALSRGLPFRAGLADGAHWLAAMAAQAAVLHGVGLARPPG